MTEGRKPVPTALKLIKGTQRADRKKEEPKPELGIPAVPPELSDEAKVEWGRMGQQLHQMGLMSLIDRAAFAGYCQAWADFLEAREKVAALGKVIKSGEKVITRANGDVERSGGSWVENPFYSVQKRSMEIMHKFLVEFGMTPSSRTRIDVGKAGGVPTGKGKPTGTGGSWGGF